MWLGLYSKRRIRWSSTAPLVELCSRSSVHQFQSQDESEEDQEVEGVQMERVQLSHWRSQKRSVSEWVRERETEVERKKGWLSYDSILREDIKDRQEIESRWVEWLGNDWMRERLKEREKKKMRKETEREVEGRLWQSKCCHEDDRGTRRWPSPERPGEGWGKGSNLIERREACDSQGDREPNLFGQIQDQATPRREHGIENLLIDREGGEREETERVRQRQRDREVKRGVMRKKSTWSSWSNGENRGGLLIAGKKVFRGWEGISLTQSRWVFEKIEIKDILIRRFCLFSLLWLLVDWSFSERSEQIIQSLLILCPSIIKHNRICWWSLQTEDRYNKL
jgi:hypothetical protein